MPQPCANILIPLALERPYSYLVPSDVLLAEGDFVKVPLGSREIVGVVWSLGDEPDGAPEKLRSVTARLDSPAMPASMRSFIDWVASYTLFPPGMVLKMAMSVPKALEPARPNMAYRIDKKNIPERMTPARRRVMDLLGDGRARRPGEIASSAQVSAGVIKTLYKQGVLQKTGITARSGFALPDPDADGPVLEEQQLNAVKRIKKELLAPGGHKTALLEGVTGAGKTEVYFEAVARVLKSGRQVLVLLPEIALTAQLLRRFKARFKAPPAAWHSALSPAQRVHIWRGIARDQVKIVVGARSALFLPFCDLGLIIVDEEHESAFKQEEGVAYHGRDMAVVRGFISKIPVILSSATPSVETLVNARSGKYLHISLTLRHGGAQLPQISTLDMRRHPPDRGKWLSPPLVAAMGETLERGEQIMLFLNRRGYAPLTLCRNCGYRISCSNCHAWLVEHRYKSRLMCHHCGHVEKKPENCPQCGAADTLVACGPGIERVAEEAEQLFPDAALAVLSSDIAGGIESIRRIFDEIETGKIDIVVGTQMLAKGHHFPALTLVGVVDGDLGLGHGDLRAGERTYQLLHQVSGRAGRARHKGQALIQTHDPEHPVMKALVSASHGEFYNREIELRRMAHLPPFGHLAGIIISGRKENDVIALARNIATQAPRHEGVRVLGPAPAPLGFLRGRYRYRLLVKTQKDISMQTYLHNWLGNIKPRGAIRMRIDVDPQSFL